MPSSTPMDLTKLCEQAQSGDAQARDQILKASMGLVIRNAQRFCRSGAFLELGDLIQQGCIGILHAIEKFDVQRRVNGKPVQFMTYAYYWVTHCIRREIESHGLTIAVPVERIADGAEPIPRAYSWDLRDAGDLDSKKPTLVSLADPADSPEQWCREWEERQCVEQLLARLPQKHRQVLESRFGLNPHGLEYTQKQIAKQLAISPSRIGALERTALLELRRTAASLTHV